MDWSWGDSEYDFCWASEVEAEKRGRTYMMNLLATQEERKPYVPVSLKTCAEDGNGVHLL